MQSSLVLPPVKTVKVKSKAHGNQIVTVSEHWLTDGTLKVGDFEIVPEVAGETADSAPDGQQVQQPRRVGRNAAAPKPSGDVNVDALKADAAE